MFNQSRINVNLANASRPVNASVMPVMASAAASAGTMRGRISRRLDRLPLGSHVKAVAKILCGRSGMGSETEESPTAAGCDAAYVEQIKGRNFEVPGCGGFMLTEGADDLDRYYENGKEVVCFAGRDDLVEKVRHYLEHDSERAAIAKAGHERTMSDHTYAIRFKDIFRRMGFGDAGETATGRGATLEVT